MADWNAVYTQKTVAVATPADVLILNEHILSGFNFSRGGSALDYASGLGGNSVYLAKKGFGVEAWDLSETAVEKINQYAGAEQLNITASVHDLENNPPQITLQFDVVVVSYFLHRQSLRYLYDLLKTGGLLFYQTFSGLPLNEKGPSRENFRLKTNELLSVFSDMQLMYYREDGGDYSGEYARPGITCFVAQK